MRKLFAWLILLFVASIAQAAINATAIGTSFASTVAVSSFTLNRPSSVNAGDLLVVQISINTSSITVTTPSGWTQLRLDTNSGSGSDERQYIFYRVATATDTANGSTSWTLSSSGFVAAGMTGFRSDLTGRSIALDTNTVDSGSNATLAGSSVTAASTGLLLRFFGYARGTTSFTSSGLNRLVDTTTSGTTTGTTILFASRSLTSAGATGADTASATNSARWLVQSLVLTESAPAKPANCYTDTFSNTTTFGQNWVTTSVGATAFTPAIISGRLRLTDNNLYESTGATLQRIFPTSNLIYVEFNHYAYPDSTGADGIAVTLSDATITPQPGGFGGSLGYANRSDSGGINGFAGGWMGIALDEYGNFSNPTEGRNGGPGFRVDSVAIRGSGSGQTGYGYVAGTATLSPGVDSSSTPGPGYRYRIVIDAAATGQTYVTVDRDTTGTGSSYANLIPTFNIEASSGQAAIPANLMLSLTGSTGGSSNIHEIGNLSVCATTINSTNLVDHFEFIYSPQALTCDSASITINACANAACSTLMSIPATVTMSSSSGTSWAGGNPITFTGSTTLRLVDPTPGTIAFSVASSSPGTRAFTTNKCNGTSSSSCSLQFTDAGFEFNVPNVLANKPSGAVRLRAVRNAGDASNSCVALFQNTTQAVNFWSSYTTPSTGTRAVELRAGSGSGTFTSISGNSGAPTGLNLTFDNNGETTFEARYQDAGLMALNARYTGSGTYAGLVLTGNDSFVSTPAGFCIRGAKLTTPPYTYANCTASFAGCPIIATVSNPFVLDITAAGWDVDNDPDFCSNNITTPNYAQNSLALSSIFGLTTAQFNAAGSASNGTVGTITSGVITSPTSVNIAASSGGHVNITNATESEVGAFTFTVTPPANAYFGVTVPSGTSPVIGRFIPHHFSVTSGSSLTNRSTSCATAPAFTYLGETLTLAYQLNALTGNNQLTQNYQGIFANLSTFSQMNTAAIAGSPRTALTVASMPSSLFGVAWNNGQGTVVSPVAATRGVVPVGPYLNTAFGVAPTDSDGVSATGFNLDTDVPASAVDRVQIGTTTELRYGRLRMDNVSGSVEMPLSLPVTAEYWTGIGFSKNTSDDNCTTISSSLSAPLSNYQGNLSNGETTLSGSSKLLNGYSNTALSLSAPGTGSDGNNGSVDITLNLNTIPWLKFDWDGDSNFDDNITATASFGTYRGSDRVIYWQETQ